MRHQSVFGGIRFIEGEPDRYIPIVAVSVQVGGIFTPGQLRSLDDIKRIMARRAKDERGNSVVDFRYGQKSVGFFRSLFNMDDVVWYGSGIVAIVPN